MIVSVEQAVKTQCCGSESCGRWIDGVRVCIAGACMAWRWQTIIYRAAGGFEKSREKSSTHGWCGLAGTP